MTSDRQRFLKTNRKNIQRKNLINCTSFKQKLWFTTDTIKTVKMPVIK